MTDLATRQAASRKAQATRRKMAEARLAAKLAGAEPGTERGDYAPREILERAAAGKKAAP